MGAAHAEELPLYLADLSQKPSSQWTKKKGTGRLRQLQLAMMGGTALSHLLAAK